MAEILRDLKDRLLKWQEDVQDPLLLKGCVELPEHAISATPDSYSTKTQVILPECRKNLQALRGVLQNIIS